MTEHIPHIFNFVTVRRPRALVRLIQRLADLGARPVIDLEDALWDVFRPERTSALKAAGRQALLALAGQPELADIPLGVRVNRVNEAEFERDLVALQALARIHPLDCVVGTKIESPQDVETYLARLRSAGVPVDRFIPIVETRRGLEQLDAIARRAGRLGIAWVVYGFFDHSLDAGHWPFSRPQFREYWETVRGFAACVEAAGLNYIQPPYEQAYDDQGLAAICSRLSAICARPFGILTVSSAQVEQIAGSPRKAHSDLPPLAEPAGYSPRERSELAAAVVAAYETMRSNERAFIIEPGTGWFITPHLYLAAKAYLEKRVD